MTAPTHKLADGTRVFPEGYDPSDLTPIDANDLLEDEKARLREMVKALREAKRDGGVTVPDVGPVDTDADSRTNINGSVQMATILGADFSVAWRLADDSMATLDADGMIALGLAVGQHVAACQYRKNALDAAIESATTQAALAALDIEDGWPG